MLILDEAHHAAPASGSRHAIDFGFTHAIRGTASRLEHRMFLSAASVSWSGRAGSGCSAWPRRRANWPNKASDVQGSRFHLDHRRHATRGWRLEALSSVEDITISAYIIVKPTVRDADTKNCYSAPAGPILKASRFPE